jgi:hypothetical protein
MSLQRVASGKKGKWCRVNLITEMALELNLDWWIIKCKPDRERKEKNVRVGLQLTADLMWK